MGHFSMEKPPNPGSVLGGNQQPMLWTISTTTLRQAVTPHSMLGRVSALIMTATAGARPVGAVLGAIVASRFGVEACLMVAAVGFLIQLLAICASRVPSLRELPA
ncbi:MFS transporter [Mesorhizobium composti]|uniref:MFS transporter n=1 Tax=Ollibium composti TaxID=2675109 RepID=A0ABY2Q1W5_9HYPH|nr:MFS transporter [Mesorhizobium composti]